jgi:YtkA-like
MEKKSIRLVFLASIIVLGFACAKSPNSPSSNTVPVGPSGKTQSIAWTGPDSIARKTTFFEPTLAVGPQSFDILIGKIVDSLTFTPDTQWTVMFSPTMPDMEDMTSPNNVQPKKIPGGYYQGTVNFSMSGLWRLTFTFKHIGDTTVVSQYFDVVLQ